MFIAIFELPEGYSEIKRVNFQKNKKLAVGLNAGVIVIMGIIFFVGTFFVPFAFEVRDDNLGLFFFKMFRILLSMMVNISG